MENIGVSDCEAEKLAELIEWLVINSVPHDHVTRYLSQLEKFRELSGQMLELMNARELKGGLGCIADARIPTEESSNADVVLPIYGSLDLFLRTADEFSVSEIERLASKRRTGGVKRYQRESLFENYNHLSDSSLAKIMRLFFDTNIDEDSERKAFQRIRSSFIQS
ncbi:hypothetical protein [Vibrio gallicus]|uniref:hypothetical protein n=1 Tax=Vibrio gallicus TaxID=190897 RepID=UPI0021C47BDB|nr:hypothetical protein [Vibrio gallicus]